MKSGIKCSASRLQIKPERKVIEKNRRNKMKFLYNCLYSLVPPDFISKKCSQVSDQIDTTIDYIQTLKNNLEISEIKREKLLREKRLQEQTKVNNVRCKSLNIQVHQISHDLDDVLVTGLNSYSSFCDVLQLLDRYSTEVTFANFSTNGHSTFHIHQKQIEAVDVCKNLKNLANQCSKTTEFYDASLCIDEVDQDLISIWDFDFQPNVWGCELGMIFNTSG